MMAHVGGIIGGFVAHQYDSAELFVFGWFLFFLGVGTYFIGFGQCGSKKLFEFIRFRNLGKMMLYPFLVTVSPIIVIVLKFLPMVRNSKLIQNMVKVASEGEVVFESAPQLTLQLYIVLSTLDPTGWTWFSITTSILSLLVSLVHSQYIENLPENTWKDYIKSAIVILPNIIFRVLSIRYIIN